MPTRVLVTGGAGYIGSHVVKLLGERGYEVLTFDNLSTRHKWAVLYGKLFVADLKDKDSIRKAFEEFKPHAVIHFAAHIVVPESVKKPLKYYRNNVASTLNLLEVMKEYGVCNFIFSSSAAVYGIPDSVPIVEESPIKPVNPYGETKAIVEKILRDISNAEDKFRYVSLRYFNAAGADPDIKIGEAHNPETHLIPSALISILDNRIKFKIFGNDYPTRDGTCIRDYIHVTDLAEAHILALEYLLSNGKSVTLNCGYGRGYSVLEVVNTIKKVTGIDFPVEYAQRREGDPPILVADSKKIKEILGWQPKYDDLEFIIDTAWKWLRKRKDMNEKC